MAAYFKTVNYLFNSTYKTIRVLCGVICSCLMLLVVWAAIRSCTDYIELPNHFRLVQTSCFAERIELRNRDNVALVAPRVSQVVWNHDYIAGLQLIDVPDHGAQSRYFIATHDKVEWFDKSGPFDYGNYIERIKNLGLKTMIGSSDAYKSYGDLRKNNAYRRAFFE